MTEEIRTLVNASNPVWSNAEQTAIVLVVEFAELPHLKKMVFAALADDCTDYGREIFTRAANGEFGEVAPFVPGRENVLQMPSMRPK